MAGENAQADPDDGGQDKEVEEEYDFEMHEEMDLADRHQEFVDGFVRDFETEQPYKKHGGIDFFGAKWRQHAHLLPAQLVPWTENLARKLGFEDLPLLKSFMYFTSLLVSYQPASLVAESTLQDLKGMHENAPKLHKFLCAHSCMPKLDSALRGRTKQALKLFRAIFKSAPLTASNLALWLLLVFIFRYTGEMAFLEYLVNVGAEHMIELMAQGLTQETLEALVSDLVQEITRNAVLRTTFTSLFAPGDGRRRFFHKKSGVVPERIVHNYRPVDHLLHALKVWAERAIDVAAVAMDLVHELEAGGDKVFELTRTLMLALLKVPLLGRPAAAAELGFNRRVMCYSLKFVFSDLLHLLAAALCSKSRSRKHPLEVVGNPIFRCSCHRCQGVWVLRLQFMFFGPSPCALHTELAKKPLGHKPTLEATVDVWRSMLQEWNAFFASSFCLYTPQLLPCTWRHFIQLSEKWRDADEDEIKNFQGTHRGNAATILAHRDFKW